MATSEDLKADVILEGGGVKGVALAGALAVLEEAGYTFPRVAGTSAGAIVSALLAAGRNAEEMRELLDSTDFRSFQQESWLDRLPGGELMSLLVSRGMYGTTTFRSWLERTLGPTQRFAQLALPGDPQSSLPPEQRYRLVVNVSDVSLGRLVRLPWDYERLYGLNAPDRPIAEAVVASMSIPFFFSPASLTYWRTKDGEARKVKSVLVDGGMLSNFPVDVFDRTDGKPPRWPTFGIKLSARPDAISEAFPKELGNVGSLAKAMLETLTSFRDAVHIDRPDVRARTIFIDTGTIRATDFDLGRQAQLFLWDAGRAAAERFLSTWDFDDYIDRFRT